MEEFIIFVNTFGWQLALIALVGIILLGVLKYANVFSKIEKENRKPIYLVISVSFSLIASAVYLLIVKSFEINYFITISVAVYALNQTMYAVYETTKLKDLIAKILGIIKEKLENKTSVK